MPFEGQTSNSDVHLLFRRHLKIELKLDYFLQFIRTYDGG